MSRIIPILSALVTLLSSQIIVNEIMFKPSSIPEPTPEWFELLNISDTTVCLRGFKWSDLTHTPAVITYDSIILEPSEFALVEEFGYRLGYCTKIIPEAEWQRLNNSGTDGVILYSPDGIAIDSAIYTAENYPCIDYGISLERKYPLRSGSIASNWNCSTSRTGSTPCKENSITTSDTIAPKLVITEIMFKPRVSYEEWIEIYNNGDTIVSLNGFVLSDPHYSGTINNDSAIVEPGEYIIFSESDIEAACRVIRMRAWPYLNNEGDTVYLKTGEGLIVDQAIYTAATDWDYNVSAERVSISADGTDPNSWKPSPAGATPCEDNAVWSPVSESKISLTITPNPFSPESDGNCELSVKAPWNASVQIRIYDLEGKLVRDFGYCRSATWDGSGAKPGAYIAAAIIKQGDKIERRLEPLILKR